MQDIHEITITIITEATKNLIPHSKINSSTSSRLSENVVKRLNIRASPLSSTTVSTLLFLEDSWNVNDGSIENIRSSPSPSAFSFISGEACWSYVFWMQMHYGYRTRGKTRENETARNYGRAILFRWPASSYTGHFATIILRYEGYGHRDSDIDICIFNWP